MVNQKSKSINRKNVISIKKLQKLQSKKVEFNQNLNKHKKEQTQDYKPMIDRFADVKKSMDQKISEDLQDQEDEFMRKKRERRERSISKSLRKEKDKEGDEDVEDSSNLLGDLAGDNTSDRKKKFRFW